MAFQIGAVCGVLTGPLICFVAVMKGSFLIFNIGTFFSGLLRRGASCLSLCRCRHRERRLSSPKAISWVLIGGVFAGVIGPQVVVFTKEQIWQPYLFAATFLAQSGLAADFGRSC